MQSKNEQKCENKHERKQSVAQQTTPLRQESHQSTTDQAVAAVSPAFVSSSPPQPK